MANTNSYGEHLKSKLKSFKRFPVTVKELSPFFSIMFLMGMVDMPVLKDCWNNDSYFGQEFIRSSGTSRNRFLNILTAIFICNMEEDAINGHRKKADQDYDLLFKVKPLLKEIQLACNTYYVPGQNVSIDERMVASKGRFCMKQSIKDKPVRWGFKF